MKVLVEIDLSDVKLMEKQFKHLIGAANILAGTADEAPAAETKAASKPAAKAEKAEKSGPTQEDVVTALKSLSEKDGGDKTRALKIITDVGDAASLKHMDASKYQAVIDAANEAMETDAGSGDDDF